MVNWQLSKQDSHWPYRGLICQLIEVTWFIWKLSAGQLIVLLDRDQCSISYFLASLGALLIMHTYWTSMLWSIDSCHTGYTGYPYPYQYHLSLSQAQMSTHRDQVFFEVIRWQVTSFQMIAGLRLIFFKKFIWNMLCLCATQLRFWFQPDLGRENSAGYYRQGRQLLLTLLTMVRFGHALLPIFILWLVKIWQLSSCRKFIQHLESCLLLCQLIMYLTVFFHCMYKMKFSCYQESSVLHGYLVFGWEIRLLSKSEILFRMASFSFFTLLDT